MANESYIIVKKKNFGGPKISQGQYGVRQFFTPVDKGGSKPAFCYPRRSLDLVEELEHRERVIAEGRIDPERKMAYEQKTKTLKKRVDLINESFKNAKEIIDKDPDKWKKRRDTLAEEIAERTPSRKSYKDRTVNPHGILRDEKQGDPANSVRPLEEVKREYTIISKAFQARGDYEEANHSFLQKDK